MPAAAPHSAFAAFASRDGTTSVINSQSMLPDFCGTDSRGADCLSSVSNHQKSTFPRFTRDHGFFTFSGAVFMGWLYC